LGAFRLKAAERNTGRKNVGSMKSALVFDVDNTLTPPRQVLRREMADTLKVLEQHFVLAAGSDLPLVRDQFLQPLHDFGYRGELDAFLCNGASRYHCVFAESLDVKCVDEFSLQAHLGEGGFRQLMELLERVLHASEFLLPDSVEIVGTRIVDRGSMLNLAPSGRPPGKLAPTAQRSREAFVKFDNATGYRRRLLVWLRTEVDRLLPGNDLTISYGGETSFDIVVRGREKTYPVRCLLKEGFDRVTYVGDALFPGGNDAAVKDFVETWQEGPCPVRVVQVENWEQTLSLLRRSEL
jgi:phosphomannomutase